MPPVKLLVCWSCKQEIEIPDKVTRTDTCPKCDQPLKCCYNCRFYDRTAHHHCTEPQADWVRYKEKANFCEFFSPRQPVVAKPAPRGREKPAETPPQKDKTKAAWDSLFKE